MATLCHLCNCSLDKGSNAWIKALSDMLTFNYGVRNKFEACKAKIMQPRLGFEFCSS